MLINLSDIMASEGGKITRELIPEMDCFMKGQENFEITHKSPVAFCFTNVEKGKVRVTGNAGFTFKAHCDRCLEEVPVVLSLDFNRLVTSPETEDEEADDLGFMEGYQLDVEAFMRNEILLNWPAKILCDEGCKGICPKCGQNLNIRDCGCDTFVPDPRMAVIQDIFQTGQSG